MTSPHFPEGSLDVLSAPSSAVSDRKFAIRLLLLLPLLLASIKLRNSILCMRRTGHVHVTFAQGKIAVAVNRVFSSCRSLRSGWRNNIPHSCSSIRESLAGDPQHYLPYPLLHVT